MKRLLSIILTLIFPISCVAFQIQTVSALSSDTLYTNGYEYILDDDGDAEITRYTGSLDDVTIPSEINGYSVKKIGTAAFYRCDINSVTIPESIAEIGWWAFFGCEKLDSVVLHDGIKNIDFGAFINCSSLKEINIPCTINYIGDDAFARSCSVKTNVYDKYSKSISSTQKYYTNTNFIINGFSGTYAEKYAADTKIVFNSIGNIMFGDVNADSKVDSSDISLIEEKINNNAVFDVTKQRAADVNCDGNVDNADVAQIEKYIENKLSYYSFESAKSLETDNGYLENKSMYCDGDSVSKGTGTNYFGNDYYSYCNYLAEKYNMNMTQKSVPGATLANKTGEGENTQKRIVQRIEKMSGNYDIILLDGGYNDMFQNIDVGTLTSSSDKSGNYDTYTTVGALERICYLITTKYPNAKKMFVLGHRIQGYDTQDMYWDAIISVLEKWDIPYVDLRNDVGLTNANDEIANQYFMYRTLKGKGDGIHPLKYAQEKVYGKLVEQSLNDLYNKENQLSFDESTLELGVTDMVFLHCKNSVELENPQYRWQSDNTNIVNVDDYGFVSAKRIGETTIRVTTANGQSASCKVIVKSMPFTLSLNKTTLNMNINESYILKSELMFGTATYYRDFYTSDNSIVSVNSLTGRLTAVNKGTAVITCKTRNGLSAKCKVTVN